MPFSHLPLGRNFLINLLFLSHIRCGHKVGVKATSRIHSLHHSSNDFGVYSYIIFGHLVPPNLNIWLCRCSISSARHIWYLGCPFLRSLMILARIFWLRGTIYWFILKYPGWQPPDRVLMPIPNSFTLHPPYLDFFNILHLRVTENEIFVTPGPLWILFVQLFDIPIKLMPLCCPYDPWISQIHLLGTIIVRFIHPALSLIFQNWQ